ncbi:MAG TPA: sugar ABC transporter permease, partial [Lachnospiraceae bacterium]|nr:sugar ABC transporter permease [Lachnospiraceae bacterium]
FEVSADALPAYKAVVVIILVVMSAPAVRDAMKRFKKKRVAVKEVG